MFMHRRARERVELALRLPLVTVRPPRLLDHAPRITDPAMSAEAQELLGRQPAHPGLTLLVLPLVYFTGLGRAGYPAGLQWLAGSLLLARVRAQPPAESHQRGDRLLTVPVVILGPARSPLGGNVRESQAEGATRCPRS